MAYQFKIKDITIKGKVILAPMAGITSFSYRKFFKNFGVGLTFSEMISDCGLIYNNKKTLDMCYSDGSDAPLAIQLFGGSKESLLKGLEILENSNLRYDILDLNLACPVPKVTKNNGGSSWLKDLDTIEDAVSALVKASKKPVTAKIRLGWEENNVENIAKTLERAGVSFLSIHCRTKKEGYTGEAHYEALANMKNIISIPFGVSGNIFSLEDAIKADKITHADAILVARGGIGNPLLVKNINNYFDGIDDIKTPNIEDQARYLFEYVDLLVKEIGEKRAVSVLKGIAPKFYSHFSFAKNIRREITGNIKSIEDLQNIIATITKNNV